MDKYEFNLKIDEIKKNIENKNFRRVTEIADEIDWHKVKNNAMLELVADAYEVEKQYEKAKEVLYIAYERTPMGRQLAYRLALLSVKTNDFVEADEVYLDFVQMAPNDTAKYILQYKIAKAKNASVDELIKILEPFIEEDMEEKWAYELAKLYKAANRIDDCIELCDELSLWFNEGEYVEKAMELKMQYKPLTKGQQERYDRSKEEKQTIEDDSTKIFDPDEIKVKEMKGDGYDTMDIQAAIAQNMESIMFDEHMVVPDPQQSMTLDPMYTLGGNGQVSLDLEEEVIQEKQITGQISIEEVLRDLENRGVLKSNTVDLAIELMDEVTEAVETAAAEKKQLEPLDEPKVLDMTGNLDLNGLDVQEDAQEEVKEVAQEEVEEIAKALEEGLEEVAGIEDAEESELLSEQFGIDSTPLEERKYLSDEDKEVFASFVRIAGMEDKIAKAIQSQMRRKKDDGTSSKNNIIIMGDEKSGKSTLAIDIIKVINKKRKGLTRKIAKVDAEALNRRGISRSMNKLIGKDLIINNASNLNEETVKDLIETANGYTKCMIIVLEDTTRNMCDFLDKYPKLNNLFGNVLHIKEYDVKEWVAFALAYAEQNGYMVDDLGILALNKSIDDMYSRNQGLEREDVEGIIDDAISRAKKKIGRKIAYIFSNKNDDSGLEILKEKDFM